MHVFLPLLTVTVGSVSVYAQLTSDSLAELPTQKPYQLVSTSVTWDEQSLSAAASVSVSSVSSDNTVAAISQPTPFSAISSTSSTRSNTISLSTNASTSAFSMITPIDDSENVTASSNSTLPVLDRSEPVSISSITATETPTAATDPSHVGSLSPYEGTSTITVQPTIINSTVISNVHTSGFVTRTSGNSFISSPSSTLREPASAISGVSHSGTDTSTITSSGSIGSSDELGPSATDIGTTDPDSETSAREKLQLQLFYSLWRDGGGERW